MRDHQDPCRGRGPLLQGSFGSGMYLLAQELPAGANNTGYQDYPGGHAIARPPSRCR